MVMVVTEVGSVIYIYDVEESRLYVVEGGRAYPTDEVFERALKLHPYATVTEQDEFPSDVVRHEDG